MGGSEDGVRVVDDGATDEEPSSAEELLQGADVGVLSVICLHAVNDVLFNVRISCLVGDDILV